MDFFRDTFGLGMPDVIPGEGFVFSAQYQAVYNAFTVKPPEDVALAQDTMVASLVSDGIWAKLDVFYVFANNTQTNALINWVNPGIYDAVEAGGGALVFTLNEGLTGDGTNYLDTGFNPATAGGSFSQNSNCVGVYSRTDSNIVAREIGLSDGTGDIFINCRLSSNFGCRCSDGGSFNNAVTDSLGFFIATRGGAADKRAYKNTTEYSINTASQAPNSEDIFVFAQNNVAGSPQFQTTRQLSMAIIGGGLTQSDVNAFESAFEIYMDFLGKGVV